MPLSVVYPGLIVHDPPLTVAQVEGEHEGAVDRGQGKVVGGHAAAVAAATARPQDEAVGGDEFHTEGQHV